MKIFETEDPQKEIAELRAQRAKLTEKLVTIYMAYFEIAEFGDHRAAKLSEAIENSMDIDMKIILELARKRGEDRRNLPQIENESQT